MTKAKTSFGILAITTLVLMVATTIGSAINTAEAQRGPPDRDPINQNSQIAQRSEDQRGLVNVGNVGVNANVAVPVEACAGVISGVVTCRQ